MNQTALKPESGVNWFDLGCLWEMVLAGVEDSGIIREIKRITERR